MASETDISDAAKSGWVRRVLGIELPPGADGSPMAAAGSSTAGAELGGMEGWIAARKDAVATLSALESAIRDMNDPDGDEAIILVRAIRANLTERPETPAQIKELETYLTSDDIIAEAEQPNGFGFTVSLRAPLLAALAGLRVPSPARAGAGA